MMSTILNSRFPLLVYQPAGVFELSWFEAVFRGGGVPVLDTEFMTLETVKEIIRQLSGSPLIFGVRIFIGDKELREYLNQCAGVNLELMVLAYRQRSELTETLQTPQSCTLFIEVRHLGLRDQLAVLPVDGLIVKGLEGPGRVSRNTAYILMQWYLEQTCYPVFVHGGVGHYTAAGMFVAGASGVVLDNQLYLCQEAPLSPRFKQLLQGLDEKDTALIGDALDDRFRFFCKLGTRVVKELSELESRLADSQDHGKDLYSQIESQIIFLNNTDNNPVQSLFYLGMDAVLAKSFVRESADLVGAVHGFFAAVNRGLQAIEDHDPLVKGSPLACLHGTEFPIIQGPMANISDNPAFAQSVYENGGLPFLAMGSLPPDLAEKMVMETSDKANNIDRFGVGMIGIESFNPALERHLDIVKRVGPAFALFAAGSPAKVAELESAGIKTYLHTPSMSLLDNAVKNGCRRFVFEGTEAGGHVGSLTSLVLWELALSYFMDGPGKHINDVTLIFAGGIGTQTGSAFITGISSLAAAKGIKIGIQVGTAYLFTHEIVQTGALSQFYQQVLSRQNQTILVGHTVGLPARTVATPFSQRISSNEHQRVRDGMPLSRRKEAFERDNICSLLIAAKSFAPDFSRGTPDKPAYCDFDELQQWELGNFMSGDALCFDTQPISLAELHRRYFSGKDQLIERLNQLEILHSPDHRIQDDIAVIGMGCVYPGAIGIEAFWQSIIGKHNAIREIPRERLDLSLYYSEDRNAEDKTYTTIAGVADQFVFYHERFGFSALEAQVISRSQQMLLEAAAQALTDAGLVDAENCPLDCFNKKKTAVIVASCLGNELGNDLHFKYYYPEVRHYVESIEEFQGLTSAAQTAVLNRIKTVMSGGHQHERPDSSVLNIDAARLASYFGVEGVNYVVDAACASSLTAVDCACQELVSGTADLVITGGVNTNLTPEAFIGFAKMGALSPVGSFPFDERADGFVLGEGAGVIILKRLKHALRDGNQIYGVIKGIGVSSDGKGKAIAAPNSAGQALAIKRCLERAGIENSDQIDYIEAHGTGTTVGDAAEIAALSQVYTGAKSIGISSVKSQIGHLLGGAGMAGLIKVLLAIRHQTLPPNGQFKHVSAGIKLEHSPFYIIANAEPWHKSENQPRSAAVSSYGFGGINYHLIVEEHCNQAQYGDQSSAQQYPIERTPDFFAVNQDLGGDDKTQVVICGLGVILPGAPHVQAFAELLYRGESVLSQIPESRFHNQAYCDEADPVYHLPLVQAGIVRDYEFDFKSYRIPHQTAKTLDRAQCFALDAAGQALEGAGIDHKPELRKRTAVILGTISGEKHAENVIRTRIPLIERALSDMAGEADDSVTAIISQKLAAMLRERYDRYSEDTVPGLLSNIVAARIANRYDLNGANFVVDAACASAAAAMELAARSVRSGDCDLALTGGVDCNFHPSVIMAFKRLGLLSSGECRYFDRNGAGFVLAEGAALMVMTSLKTARKYGLPILAAYHGTGFAASPQSNMYYPAEQTFMRAINAAYHRSPISHHKIRHLDVFGFSAYLLDKIEYQSIEQIFQRPLFFGNIKPEFGYFKGANPAVAAAKLILMTRDRSIPTNFNYHEQTAITRHSKILKPSRARIEAAGPVQFAANVFGFGGNHGHFVIGSLPFYPQETQIPRIAALLSGQGAQYPGMMRDLYQAYPDIRNLMDQGEQIFQKIRGYSLLEIMFQGGDALNQTVNTQPAIFLATAAINHYLKHNGFTADIFLGHSIGEYSALYCAGALDFEGVMLLVIRRSEFMQQAGAEQPGGIMAVMADAETVAKRIADSNINCIYIANKNSLRQTAVSGSLSALEAFGKYLTQHRITFKRLALSAAFHSPLLTTAADHIARYLNQVRLNGNAAVKIYSNVTGLPHTSDPNTIKSLLSRQIISPVEFTAAMHHIRASGINQFIEIGPGRILINLLKHSGIEKYQAEASVDPKIGEISSLTRLTEYLRQLNRLPKPNTKPEKNIEIKPETIIHIKPVEPEQVRFQDSENFETISMKPVEPEQVRFQDADDFKTFLKENEQSVQAVLYQEFLKHKREKQFKDWEKFNFYTGGVRIAGVSVGLPGTGYKVFDSDNFDRILKGTSFIEPLSREEEENIADMQITRLLKGSDGNARMVDIQGTEDVIHLAGKLGYFNLRHEYGIERDYDITYSLAIAAGLEALKDAHIPLVPAYRETRGKERLPAGYALPEEMQHTTGVISTSLFPGFETLLKEMNAYYYNKFHVRPYTQLENVYYHLMTVVTDNAVKEQLTDWFFKVRERRKEYGNYRFSRNLLFDIIPLGSAHFAELIRAKGPNMQMTGACASTTQAIGVAEDWIRGGRCDRVIVIAGEASTSITQGKWIGSGFLALGAATVKRIVPEAAKPFDTERNGMILGSGAVALIVEREDKIQERGLAGQAEILGTYIGNSAFHGSRMDVTHLSAEMKKFVERVENRHDLDKQRYTDSLLFMSHETFTPARGGSAAAEVTAITQTFPDHYPRITITNTKGFTGHTLGAGIEDAVLVKALQQGMAPPIANLKNIPPEFKQLNFSTNTHGDYRYGLHFAAGFGSHFSFLFLRKITETTTDNNPLYQSWLQRISGLTNPALIISHNTLKIQDSLTTSPPPETQLNQAAYTEKTDYSAYTQTNTQTGSAQHHPPIHNTILDIIAAQTGYSQDMLEDDLDLEADLGVDTVKQVEIFGRISAEFGLTVPEDLRLTDLNTIAKLTDYISERLSSSTLPADHNQLTETQTTINAIRETIASIISQQTGYDTDMLEDDLDLEADLGVDTVKQVEIFGRISAEFGLTVPEDLRLTDLNTIAKLTDYIQRQQTGQTPVESTSSLSIAGALTTALDSSSVNSFNVNGFNVNGFNVNGFNVNGFNVEENHSISRLVPTLVVKPAVSELYPSILPHKLLVTLDDQGFGQAFVQAVRRKSGTVIVAADQPGADYRFDPACLDSVKNCMLRVMQDHPDLRGLVHFSPLNAYLKHRGLITDKLIERDITSMFLMVQTLYPLLNRTGGLIAVPSFESVLFPYSDRDTLIHPIFAGLAGMMKTMNKELPETLVKIVDFSWSEPLESIETITEHFIAEIVSGDKTVEIGYDEHLRFGLSLVEQTAALGSGFVRNGDRVLAAGGARGITFEILKALISRYQTDLVILGRSNISDIDPGWLEPNADQAFIMEGMKAAMKGRKPVEIKQAVQTVLRKQEILANLHILQNLGVNVVYHSVDVADHSAISALIPRLGHIDGLIYAAGIEESAFIPQKTLQSFQRVMHTKVLGAQYLLEALGEIPYRYALGFSSVTARLGNEGQVDYTAANDMLGKLFQQYQRQYPHKVFKTMAWTAWDETGMAASDTVKKVLTERGLRFLPVEQGVDFFLQELTDTEQSEVVISGKDRNFDTDGLLAENIVPPVTKKIAPFLDKVKAQDERGTSYVRRLDLKRDKFLLNHAKDDTPIFLGATGIEAMAEAAAQLFPSGSVLTEIVNFSIPYGIKILKQRPKDIVIQAKFDGLPTAADCRITSQFRHEQQHIPQKPKLHFEGTCIFSQQYPAPPDVPLPDISGFSYQTNSAYPTELDKLLYHPRRLFMDGIFKSIKEIVSFDGSVLITRLQETQTGDFFYHEPRPAFVTNVVIIDGMFQTGGLLEMLTSHDLVLPFGLKRMRFFQTIEPGQDYLCVITKLETLKKTRTYNLSLLTIAGSLAMNIEQFEMVKISSLEPEYRIADMIQPWTE